MSVVEKSGQLRIGIVGAGYVSRHHIRALKQLDFVSIVALADQQLGAAQVVQEHGETARRKHDPLNRLAKEADVGLTPK